VKPDCGVGIPSEGNRAPPTAMRTPCAPRGGGHGKPVLIRDGHKPNDCRELRSGNGAEERECTFVSKLIVVTMFFVMQARRTCQSQPHSSTLGRHRALNQNVPRRGHLHLLPAGWSTRSKAGGVVSTWCGSHTLHYSSGWISNDAPTHSDSLHAMYRMYQAHGSVGERSSAAFRIHFQLRSQNDEYKASRPLSHI
jgi:hypothetical protein